MTPEQCYGACVKLIQQTLEGAGAVRGVPCELENIEEQDDAFLITYKWEEKDGSVHRQEMLIPKPHDLMDNYDYDEVLVGSWVNGEPIYKRTIEIAEPNLIQKGVLFKVCDLPVDFLMLIKGSGIIRTYEGSYSNNDILIYSNKDGIYAKQNFTGYPERIYITIEYTKLVQPE